LEAFEDGDDVFEPGVTRLVAGNADELGADFDVAFADKPTRQAGA
jgi:hypothetical protein